MATPDQSGFVPDSGQSDPDQDYWNSVGFVHDSDTARDAPLASQGGFSDVWQGTKQRMVGAAEALGGQIFDQPDWNRNAAISAEQANQYVGRASDIGGIPGSISDIHGLGDVGKFAAAGMIQSAPQLALVGGGMMLGGLPGLAVAGALDTGYHAGETMANRMSEGQDADMPSALGWGVAQSALDVGTAEMGVPAGKIAGSLGKMFGSEVAEGAAGAASKAIPTSLSDIALNTVNPSSLKGRLATGIAAEGLEQAGIGAGQAAISDRTMGRDVTGKDLAEGAIVGGVMGAPFGAFKGMRYKPTTGGAGERVEPTLPPIQDKTQGPTDLMAAQPQSATWTVEGGGGGGQAGRWSRYPNGPAEDVEFGIVPPDSANRLPGAGPARALPAPGEAAAAPPGTPQLPGPDAARLPPPRGTQADMFGGGGTAPTPPTPPEPWRGFPRGSDIGQMSLDLNAPHYPERTGSTYADPAAIQRLSEAAGMQGPATPIARPPTDIALPPERPAAPPPGPIAVPPARRPVIPADMPPRAQEAMRRARAAAQAEAAVGPPEQRVARPAPDIDRGFKLQAAPPGESWGAKMREAMKTSPPGETVAELQKRIGMRQKDFELEPSPGGHAGQRELDLGGEEAQPAPTKQKGQAELLPPTEGGGQDWQQGMRDAWKEAAGNMQGVQALSKALKAKDAETAAQLIRDKANDPGNTPLHKLDAVHKALTGESLEEHAARTEGERHAPKERKQQGDGQQERQGNGEGRAPAEAGGGGGAEQGGKEQVRAAEKEQPASQGKGKRKGKPAAERDTAATSGSDAGGGTAEPERPVARAAGEAERVNPEQPADTRQLHVDPIELARSQATEDRPGLRKLAKNLEDQLSEAGRKGIKGKARQDIIDALSHIANLEKDKVAVKTAREALEDMAYDHEIAKAYEATKVEAAERTSQDVRGAFRRGEATTGAHDTDLHAMAEHGIGAHDALDHIIETHPDPKIRELAQALKERVGDGVNVRHATAEERAAAPPNTLAEWKNGEVILHSPDGAAQSVLHELVHHASDRALEGGGPAALDMRRLYAEAMKEKALLGEYGLESVHEFMAEAFSNPAFRDRLAQIRSGSGTMWDRFKSAVKRLLGMKDNSLLDSVMEAGHRVMDEQTETSFSHGDGSSKSLYRQASSGTATGFTNSLADAAGSFFKDVARGAVKTFAIHTMPTHIIVRKYGHLFEHGELEHIANTMDRRKAYIGKLQRTGAEVYEKLKGAYKAEGKNLDRMHDVMSDTQRAGVNPKGVDPAKAQADLAKAQDAYNKVKAGDKSSLAYLKARDALDQAQAVVNARSGWEKLSDAAKETLDSMYDKLAEMHKMRHDMIQDMMGSDAEFLPKTKGPYAPLRRDGKWIASFKSKALEDAESALADARSQHMEDAAALKDYTQRKGKFADQAKLDALQSASDASTKSFKELQQRVELMSRSGEHRIVQAVRNAGEATRLADEWKGGANAKDATIHTFTKDDFYKGHGGHRDAMLTDMMSQVDKKFGDSPQAAEIKKMLMDTYIDHLPDGSAATISAHRQMVAGWSKNFSQAVIERLGRDAFQIGTLKYALPMRDALSALDDARRTSSMPVEANKAYSEFARRSSHEQNYDNYNNTENVVTALSHAYYLGFSPGFLMMNMMQSPMIAAPVMGGRHGVFASLSSLLDATRDVHAMTKLTKGGELDFSKAKNLSADQIRMLQQVQDLGLLDMTMGREAMNKLKNVMDPQTAGEAAIGKLGQARELMDIPIAHVETLNRGGTALAAYRLEAERLGKKGGMSPEAIHEAATKYAVEVLRDSHVDYSAEANPTMFRQPGMRVMLQFKKYGLAMTHMVAERTLDAVGHPIEVSRLRAALATASEAQKPKLQARLDQLIERRGEARKMMTGLLGMHQLFSGALGLPFAGLGFAAADVLRGFMGDPEQKYDTQADFQNYLADALGTDAATLVARGVPAALLGVDLSRRAGMGDVVPFTQQVGQAIDSMSGGNPNVTDKMLVSIMGPGWGMGEQWFNGAQKFSQGDYAEGAAALLPRGVFNMLQGYKMREQGIQVGGKTVGEPLNTSATIASFLGLPSTQVQQTKDAAISAKESQTVFSAQRNKLVKEWSEARANGEGVPSGVADFNRRNPQSAVTMGDVVKLQQSQKAGPKRPTGGSKGQQLRDIQKERMRYAQPD